MSKIVSDSFMASIESPAWFPVRRLYIYDNLNNPIDITNRVVYFDKVLWLIEQQFHLNSFLASNCRIDLKNEDEIWDVDNPNNFFVTELSQPQDGYRVKISIKVGYVLNGTEELLTLFTGHIIDIDTTTKDDIASIEVQCVSKILRDANTDNIGDEWVNQQLYGGNSHCYTSGFVGANVYNITVYNTPSGNFPAGFPPAGLIGIDDEIIWYGSISGNTVYGCLRGQMGTVAVNHAVDTLVQLLLADGSETMGINFQFPVYPVSPQSISAISSSNGVISLVDSDQLLGKFAQNIYGWIDYDKGVITLGDELTDDTTIAATYKSCYKQITYHSLVKKLLTKEGFSTTYVEDAFLEYFKAIAVPSSYGRITRAYDGTTPVDLGFVAEAYALCIGNNYLYIGVGTNLIQFDGEQFNWLADLGGNNTILRMLSDNNNNIYIIGGDINSSSLRSLYKWNGVSVSTLVSGIAAYHDPISPGLDGGQWRGFNVDITNNVIWFLYDDGATKGIAKVNFDGTGLTKYDRAVDGNYQMDFADSGSNIEFFYHDGSGNLKYDSLLKATGIWTNHGNIYTGLVDPSPCDCVYHPIDDKIYLNIVRFTVPTTSGSLISIDRNSVSPFVIDSYNATLAERSRYCGGVYYNEYVWYIKGDMTSDGYDDLADGHLYRIANNTRTDMGAMAHRKDRQGHITGHSAVMAARNNDDAIFFISADLTSLGLSTDGFSLQRFSPNLSTFLSQANINNASIWDILSELAVLVNYEVGVTGDGNCFWRSRTSTYTYLNGNINATVTTIPTTGVNMSKFEVDGFIQIDQEVIEYTGKTANSFTGCTRGCRGSIANTHTDAVIIRKIVQTIVNLIHEKNLKLLQKYPNWDEIFNYIIIPYGEQKVVFNYVTAGEVWTGSSEQLYGRRELSIQNRFLTHNDGFLAESIGWRYYNHYKQRWSLYELETKWQPQLDLGDPVSIKQLIRVLADYTIGIIRRIEIDMTDFYMRLTITTRPSLDIPTIYDA